MPNWTWLRRTLSRWGNTYARTMLRLAMNDATTAFRAYRADVLEAIDIDGTTELDFDRDDGPGSASVIGFTPTLTGTYFLQVTEDGNNNIGTYMLDVSEVDDEHE